MLYLCRSHCLRQIELLIIDLIILFLASLHNKVISPPKMLISVMSHSFTHDNLLVSNQGDAAFISLVCIYSFLKYLWVKQVPCRPFDFWLLIIYWVCKQVWHGTVVIGVNALGDNSVQWTSHLVPTSCVFLIYHNCQNNNLHKNSQAVKKRCGPV